MVVQPRAIERFPAQLAAVKAFDLTVAADRSLKVDVDIETGQTQVPHAHQSFLYPLHGSETATTSEVIIPGPEANPNAVKRQG